MLGLAEEVGGDDRRAGGLVGDHEDLGRAGEQIDADEPEQLPLGLRDVGVPGADEQVDRLEAGQRAVDQCAERLDAADRVDGVRARGAERVERRVGHAVRSCGRRGGDPLDARHLGDEDAHQRAADQLVAAAGNVGADAADRYVAMAEQDALADLHLEVEQRRALRLREAADLGGRGVDVAGQLGGDGGGGAFEARRRRRGSPVDHRRRASRTTLRTAGSPRSAMSSRIAATVRDTSGSGRANAGRSPRFR